jgi:hypothetical protein
MALALLETSYVILGDYCKYLARMGAFSVVFMREELIFIFVCIVKKKNIMKSVESIDFFWFL